MGNFIGPWMSDGHREKRPIAFRLHAQADAYLTGPGWRPRVACFSAEQVGTMGLLSRRASQSLICSVIRGKLEPTRLRLDSPFLAADKDGEKAESE